MVREHYPSFEIVDPPPSCGAVRAWRGSIIPFPDSSQLGLICEDLDRHAVVAVDVGGCLRHQEDCRFLHSRPAYLSKLVHMNLGFDILVLEFAGTKHRQAYCLAPLISACTFPTHPHLRRDQRIWVDRYVEALCPYRSDETGPLDFLTYLDFVSIYLAKHLVWVRTLSLVCYSEGLRAIEVYSPPPNGGHFTPPIPDAHLPQVPCTPWQTGSRSVETTLCAAASQTFSYTWEGTWLGPSAPHDVETILQTVTPDKECVCGTGRKYGCCCRSSHVAFTRRQDRHRFQLRADAQSSRFTRS